MPKAWCWAALARPPVGGENTPPGEPEDRIWFCRLVTVLGLFGLPAGAQAEGSGLGMITLARAKEKK